MGKAFNFFKCRASKEKINSELPDIKEMATFPPIVEISLHTLKEFAKKVADDSSLKDDKPLIRVIQNAEKYGIQFVLALSHPYISNSLAADELADFVNLMYSSPLYEKGEKYEGRIVYKEYREYIFRE